jgi:hypothetical protein
MKTQNLFSYLCVILFVLTTTMTKAQTVPCDTCTKTVFFLHGLGGDVNSWQRAASAMQQWNLPGFPRRKALPFTLDYSHVTTSLADMANTVHSYNGMNPSMMTLQNSVSQALPWFQPENSIIISHSQGGLVARAMDIITDTTSDPLLSIRRHSAIATFGTAHQGAAIAGNIYSTSMFTPSIQNFLSMACLNLGNAEAARIFGKYWSVISLLSSDNMGPISLRTCDLLVPTVMNTFFNDFQIPAISDYTVGSPVITAMNTYPHQTPIVLFYGEEETPVFWRTMYSLRQSDTALGPVGFFNQDDDQEGVSFATQTAFDYAFEEVTARNNARRAQNRANALSFMGGVFLPAVIHLRNVARNERERSIIFERAKNFTMNMNEYWEMIIGARTITREVLGYTCTCLGERRFIIGPKRVTVTVVADPIDCINTTEFCRVTPIFRNVVTHKPNDGIVLSESAGELGVSTYKIPMERTNHQQMRNVDGTRNALNGLFNGDQGILFIIQPQ